MSQEVAACWSPLQQALGFGTCLCLSFLYLFLCIRFDGLSWTAPACALSVLWCLCFVLALRSSFVHVVGGLLPALSRFFVVLTHVCVPFLCTSSGVALHVGCASLVCVSAVPRRYFVLRVLWVLSRTLVFVCSCGGGCLCPLLLLVHCCSFLGGKVFGGRGWGVLHGGSPRPSLWDSYSSSLTIVRLSCQYGVYEAPLLKQGCALCPASYNSSYMLRGRLSVNLKSSKPFK